jgi:hypothetical protein
MTGGWLGLLASASLSGATPCLSAEEAQALIIVSLPGAVMSARAKCRNILPETSALTQAGGVVAARWKAGADLVSADANRAIDKISRLPVSAMFGQAGAQKAIQPIISREIAKRLGAGNCAQTSELIDSLSPLSARNVARALIALGSTDAAVSTLPFSLCKTRA